MRIYSELIYQYNVETKNYEVVSETFEDYEGPVALCGGGGGGKGSMGKAGLSILSSLMGGQDAPEAPPMQAPPPIPAPAPAPPPPTESTAKEAGGEEAIIDSEAARIRAQKRRANKEGDNLFDLSQPADTSTTMSKSILGE